MRTWFAIIIMAIDWFVLLDVFSSRFFYSKTSTFTPSCFLLEFRNPSCLKLKKNKEDEQELKLQSDYVRMLPPNVWTISFVTNTPVTLYTVRWEMVDENNTIVWANLDQNWGELFLTKDVDLKWVLVCCSHGLVAHSQNWNTHTFLRKYPVILRLNSFHEDGGKGSHGWNELMTWLNISSKRFISNYFSFMK